MDQQVKRARAAIILMLVGTVMLLLWIGVRSAAFPWQPAESVRVFLVVVGAPLLLLGTLLRFLRPRQPPV